MAQDVVIRAEGLGKKYIIGHHADNERYSTLRDTLSKGARNFGRSARRLFTGGAPEFGPEREEFWALRDIDFEIRRGDVVGIIGRNGAGKSTLLKILSRITEPSTGRVEIHGRVASLLEVGTGFHPELTGRENIFLSGAILGMTREEIRRKFDEMVDFAGTERFLDTPVKRYSSGMYVRLAFAVAAHLEPEIMVVDEVLAVGDAAFQKKCLGKMQDVAGHGRTVLFVSHNMAAVQALCSRAIWLNRGQSALQADVGTIVSAYLAADAGEIDVASTRSLGPVLELDAPRSDPVRPVSGQPWKLSFALRASKRTRVDELALLVYSPLESRVGIVDLRGLFDPVIEAGGETRFKVDIEPPELVEGVYKLGFWIVSPEFSGDVFDVATLELSAIATPDGRIPYPPQSRGVIDLKARVRVERAVAISTVQF